MCGKMDLGCYIKDGFQAAATNVLEQLRQQADEAALATLKGSSFWLRPETPAVAKQHGDSWTNSPTVEFLQHNLLGVTAGVFALAIIVAGMRIAWEQRARPLQDLLKAILTFVIVGAAGTATMQLLVAWSDAFAVYIVDHAGKDIPLAAAFGGNSPQELVAGAIPTLVAISIAGGVIVASLIQMILMLVRSAMLVLLAGTFPLAAAATNTEIGRNWFKKFCGWSLAFIAYKPAAALVYAAAMMMAREGAAGGSDALVRAMSGMMMLLLAIFALPALLRFMVPVTAAVAGGSAAMGSSVADPGGMATGAINVASSGGGFGSGSGRGAGSSAGSSAGGGPGGGGGGGGATGAQTAGAGAGGFKAAGAIAGPAGIGLAAARKAAGGLAGAAAHSAGESGGGSVTPPSATGAMAGRGGSRSSRSGHRGNSGGPAQHRQPEPAGPSGSW